MARDEEKRPFAQPSFDENAMYDRFPHGAREGFGPDEGYNRWVRINDAALFTDEARRDPVVAEFLAAPFSVEFAQFKSSHRETEYFIHKPQQAMSGQVDGIEGVQDFPKDAHIMTFVMNHEATLAKLITRSLSVVDRQGSEVGQLIHKQEAEAAG
jgi:hypothetical protein